MDKPELPPKILSKSLTRRVMLLSLFGLTGLIATTLLSLWVTLHRVEMNMNQVKIEAARDFDSFFLKSQSELLATGEGLAAHQDDINSELLALRTRNNAFLDVIFLNTNGEIIAQRNAAGRPKRITIEESEWLNPESPFGKVAISPVRFEGQAPYVDMAVTATDAIGLPAGLLIVRVDLTQLWNKTLDIQVGTTGYAYIVDEAGQLVAFRNRRYLESGNTLQKLVGRTPQALAQSGLNLYSNLNAQFVLAASQPMTTVPWFAIVEQPVREALSPFIPVGTILLLAIVIVGFLLNNMIQFTQTRIVSPLLSLQRVVSQMGSRQLEGKGEILSNDELGQFGQTFNQMVDEIMAQTESLRMAEADYRAIFVKAPVGIFRSTEEGRFLKINPAMAKMYGYGSPEEMIDQVTSIAEQVYVDRSARNEFQRLLAEYGEAQGFTVQNYRKDGSIFWISTSSRAVKDEAGRILYYEGFIEDVTERKHAEDALRENEERFHSLFDNATIGMYRTTPGGRVLLSNPAGIRMLGYSSFEELENHNLEDAGFEPEYERRHFHEIMERDGYVNGLESAWKRKDGSTIYIRESATAVKDQDGNILYYDGTFEDITEQKHAEEALRESEARYRQAIMAAGAVPYYRDYQREAHIYTFIGEGIFQLTGYSAEEITPAIFDQLEQECIMHGSLAHLTPDEAGRLSETREIRNWVCDYRILTRDGQTRWVSDAAVQVWDENNRRLGVIGILQDITERKQAEERIEQSQARYRLIAENVWDVIWVMDVETQRFTYVSPSSLKLRGYTPEEIMTQSLSEALTAESAQQAGELLSYWIPKFTADPSIPVSVTSELDQPCKDGSIVHTEVTATLVMNEKGKLEVIGVSRDITERKQAEEILREHQQMITAIVESSHDWIWTLDNTGHHTYSNAAVKQILGYTPAEFQGMGLELLHPEDRRLVDAQWPGWVEARQGWSNLVLRWCNKDGNYRYLESTAVPILDSQGELLGYHGVDRDITERKRAEETLRESEERLRAIVDAAPFGAHMYQLEPDGRLVFIGANSSADQILHVDNKQFVGKTIEEAFPPLIDTEIPDAYRHVAVSGERFEMDQVDYDDAGIRGAFEIHAFQTGNLRMAVFFRDITERKQAEEALRESEERWRTVVESEPECVKILDSEGIVVEMNPAGLGMIQAALDDVRGKRVSGLVVEEDRADFEEMVRAVFRGETRRLDFAMIGLKGQRLTLETVSVPLWDSAEKNRVKFLVGVTRDITERKRAEVQLQEQLDELRRWHQVTIGREDRIIALKREVNELLEMAGKPPRYPSADTE